VTFTLAGRLQTRLALLSSVGVLWTLIVSLPLAWVSGVSPRLAYRVTLETAIAVILFGLVWELVYHGLQQLRWDKDWPALLGLVTFFNEAVPIWVVLHALRLIPGRWGISSPILPLFATYLGTTWVLVWLVLQGPLRMVVPRWRFEGGTFSRRGASDLTVFFVVTNIGMILALATLWVAWN
jgi:hypothetical protein